MDQAGDLLNQDQFTCAICLDLLREPVAIPCGHSYCMVCIKQCWNNREPHSDVYRCPQCRQTFSPRPPLNKNTMLADLVEKLSKARLQAAPAHCYAGPGDVVCDICTGKQCKAVMSCLVCLASYCETHLQPHYKSPPLKKHKLLQATEHLHEKICSHHDKLLEIYCRTDQQCICYVCTMDHHRGHVTVSVAEERTEKQKQLVEIQKKSLQKIQEREKELQRLRQAVESFKLSEKGAAEASEGILTELIHSIQRRSIDATELIGDQEKTTVSQAVGLLKHLEKEIADMRRRDAELEKLSRTTDNVNFLQSFQSFLLPRDSTTRKLFLQLSCQLSLDPNTAHKHLRLSEGNREVAYGKEAQPYPDHPERFDCWEQVLCREGLSGLCYWEVEWSGRQSM